MTTSNDKPDLKPRAIAVLCALRSGPLSVAKLRVRIGEQRTDDTHRLLGDMAEQGLVRCAHAAVWYCDEGGRAWLENHGLTIDYDLTWPASEYATGVQ